MTYYTCKSFYRADRPKGGETVQCICYIQLILIVIHSNLIKHEISISTKSALNVNVIQKLLYS